MRVWPVVLAVLLGGACAMGNAAADGRKADSDELHDHMEAVNRAFRQVRRSAEDPAQRDEAMAQLAEMQRHVVAAKSLVPPKQRGTAEDQASAAAADFRLRMAHLLQATTTLEIAILEGDTAAVQDTIERINNLKQQGHERFGVRE